MRHRLHAPCAAKRLLRCLSAHIALVDIHQSPSHPACLSPTSLSLKVYPPLQPVLALSSHVTFRRSARQSDALHRVAVTFRCSRARILLLCRSLSAASPAARWSSSGSPSRPPARHHRRRHRSLNCKAAQAVFILALLYLAGLVSVVPAAGRAAGHGERRPDALENPTSRMFDPGPDAIEPIQRPAIDAVDPLGTLSRQEEPATATKQDKGKNRPLIILRAAPMRNPEFKDTNKQTNEKDHFTVAYAHQQVVEIVMREIQIGKWKKTTTGRKSVVTFLLFDVCEQISRRFFHVDCTLITQAIFLQM